MIFVRNGGLNDRPVLSVLFMNGEFLFPLLPLIIVPAASNEGASTLRVFGFLFEEFKEIVGATILEDFKSLLYFICQCIYFEESESLVCSSKAVVGIENCVFRFEDARRERMLV